MPDNNLKSMLCPHCRKLISANAETCIHCGRRNPKALTSLPFLQNFFSGQISFAQGIFTACIVIYGVLMLIDVVTLLMGGRAAEFSPFSPSRYAHSIMGWTGRYPILVEGRWWTLITAVYLHGNLLHIFFNMWIMKQMAPVVEELFGSSRFFIIYTVAGILGFVISTLFRTPLTLGASGAIFGLVGAIIYYGRHRGGTFGQAVYRQSAQWAVLMFVFGFLFPGIDNFAHAGGLAGGYLAAMALSYQDLRPETFTHRLLALACLAATVLAFVINLLYVV